MPIEGRGREKDSKSTIASNRSVGASEEDEEALNGSTLPLKEKKDRDENEYMDVEEDVTEDVTVEGKVVTIIMLILTQLDSRYI